MLFAKTMATHDAVHYPDRLHKLYIVNAPSIFPPAWEFISMLLDEEVSHHVHLLSGEHSWRPMLEAAMDPSILPKSMGGTFTTSVQVPGLCPLTIPKPSPPEPAEPAPAPKALAREQERSLLASKAAKARAPVHAPSPASRPAPATAMSSGAAGPVPPDQCQAPSHGASSSSSSTEPDGLDGLTRDPTVEVAAGHGIHVDTAAEHQSAAADAPAAGKWNLATDAAAPIATPTATPDIAMSAAEVSAMEAAEVTAMEGLEEIMAPDEMDAQMEYALSELPAEFGGGFGGFVHTPQQEERQERVASHGVSECSGQLTRNRPRFIEHMCAVVSAITSRITQNYKSRALWRVELAPANPTLNQLSSGDDSHQRPKHDHRVAVFARRGAARAAGLRNKSPSQGAFS